MMTLHVGIVTGWNGDGAQVGRTGPTDTVGEAR
jgi:hypothetical protein